MARLGLLLLVGALAASASKFFDDSFVPTLTETVFRPGVEYTYKYDSQVLTGIPNGGNQFSGLKIKCLVRLLMKSPSHVVMKLDEIKLCEVNSDLRTSLPSEMIPEEMCTASTSDHFRVMITELTKPISFRYDNGLVSRLESDISDPFWSVNIKRAVLNLLHVSLRQERQVTDISPEDFAETTEFTLRNVINRDRSFDKIFKVKEHDVVGDCETLYAVYEKDPAVTSCSDCFHVTKVKDYKRCTDKAIHEQGLFAGHTSWLWLPNDERKSTITPVTHVTYEMSGTRANFLIHKVKLHSEYIFTPYSEEGGSMVTYIKCHLTLVNTDAPSVSIVVGPTPVVHNHALLLHVPHALTTLSKSTFSPDTEISSRRDSWDSPRRDSWDSTTFNKFERESTIDRESFASRNERESSFDFNREKPTWGRRDTEWESPEFRTRSSRFSDFPEVEGEESIFDESVFNKWESSYRKFDWSRDSVVPTPTSNIDKVRVMLKEIVSTMTPYITEETPSKIIHLKRVLETCTSDELWTIVNDICSIVDTSEVEHKKIKEIVLDLLPAIQKPVVPHIIRSLVSKNVIYPKRGAYMIALYSLMAPPCPRTVKSMLSACKHPVMLKTDSQLRRTCILGLGTVTHKLFGHQLKTKVAKTVFFGVIEEVVRELKTLFLTSTSLETKILVLKTIGNTGLPQFLPELQRIIKDKTHPIFIRKLAVYALRRMTILTPTEVNKVCLPIFMDSREPSEMRISCFLMTMYTKPRTSTVLLMTHRLRNDPSTNLKSFVYSYLSSLAKTSLPAHHYAAKAAKLALQTMKPYDFGFSHSKGYHFDFHHEKLDFGAMLESFLIHTPTSSLPKGFVIKLGSVLAHRPYYLFETGVEVKGLDDVISNIYSRARPVWTRLSSYDWSRFMTPEWYREISPEVSSWFASADKLDVRDWLKSFETPETSWNKADWGSVDSTMRDILGKIKFEDRSRDLPELFTYFKILSNQVTFFNFDKNIVSDIISNSEWLSTLASSYKGMGQQIPVNVIKTLPLIDNCYIIPTPMGMPLHLNFTALAIAKITGHVTPVSLPSLRDILSRSISDEIKLAVDVKPSFAVKLLCEMGVHFNVMKATTAIKSHVIGHAPIKSNILLNWAEKKFKLDWEVPTESFTPLKVGMKVVTRIFKLPLRHFHLITSNLNEEKDIVHPTVVKSVPISVSPIATVFGVDLGLTSELSTRRAAWSPFYPLCGRFRFHVTCTPSEERPRLAEFKAIFGSSYPSEFYTSRSPVDRFESTSSDEYDVLSSVFPARKDYRTSIRDEVESEIDAVTPFSEISSPRSRHVTMILRTIGGSRTRYIQTHLTWVHSLDYLKHQLNYQFRLGCPNFGWSWNAVPVKAMFDTYLNLKTLFRPYTKSDSLVGKIDFFSGDRTDESDFSLKVLSGRTGMSWESEYSPLSRYSWASNLPGNNYEYYTTLTYNRLPTFVDDKLTQGLELLKVKLYPYLYIKKTGLTSDSNKITAYIKILPKHKKLTAIINTPTELDFIVDVPTFHPMFEPETVSLAVPSPVLMTEGFTPSSLFSTEEFSTRTSPRWSWFKSFTGMCTVTDNEVKTFDDVTYSMPELPVTCETILARDCSSTGLWMVTVTPMTSESSLTTTTMKMVRVLVPRFEFKLQPSGISSEMTLFVNGIPKMLTSGQPMTLPDTTVSSDDAAFTITKAGEMIKVECMRSGIVVVTNGKYIMIKSTSAYRGRVCGMCGNFDGQRFNEYEGPMKTLYERPEHSVIKYTIPSAECSISDLTTKHNVPSDSVYSGECLHEMRNIAKATYMNGEKKICFTIKPEPVCSESCKRINQRPKYASFHCLPANDVTTQTLMRERTQRVLTELAWKRVDLTDYIDTQDKCVSI